MRIGIVGTGAVAQLVHLPICTERTDVEVVALADADTGKAGALAERFGVPRVETTEDLLQDDELDGVILCTPNHLHEVEAVTALEAGRHVLVERPMALTPDGCQRIVETAEDRNRIAMVGMSHRFRPDVSALRGFVQGKELGEIYAGRVAWMNRSVPMRRTTWRQNPSEAGGGALMDLGVQCLDLILWILGQPRVRRLTAVAYHGEPEVEDAATLLLETETGTALTVEVSWVFFAREDRHYVRVSGSEGVGQLPPLEMFKQLGGRPMDVTPEQNPPLGRRNRYMSAHRRQLDHFFRSIRGFAPLELPQEQIRVMELIQAAYTSMRTGQEVRL
ncbi:MAG: Gfo/Idh/MocA family oxidoreductase [Gemmatimonadota bacterium]